MVLAQKPRKLISEIIVGFRCCEMGEIGIERADIAVNRHIIIIKNDKKIRIGIGSVVKPLERETATDGGIAYNRYDIAERGFVLQRTCHSHAKRCRNGVRGMACSKCIIFAFLWRREAA